MKIEVKHTRQQWPVGHGFFHTAMVNAEGKVYRYVYDCGATRKSIIEKHVDRFSANVELDGHESELDMVVVSHFHADHIKGIPHLLKKFNVKYLVIPYLQKDFELVALASLAASGPTAWRRFSGLVTNPERWIAEQIGPDVSTKVVRITNQGSQESPSLNDSRPGESEDGLYIDSAVLNHISHATIRAKGIPFWAFKFFVMEEAVLASKVLSLLTQKWNLSHFSLGERLKSREWISRHWKDVKEVYGEIDSGRQNATTVCMYAGSLSDAYVFFGTNPELEAARIRGLRYFLQVPLGWLGTGDAELKSQGNFEEFRRHFDDLIRRVDTVTIPHHGSIHNYNPSLGDIGLQHVVTSSHEVDPKGRHPSPAVVLNLQMKSHRLHLVTKEPRSAFFQRFDAIFL